MPQFKRLRELLASDSFAWTVLIYTAAVIVWGPYVRATGSGAGCGAHWPLCNGQVVPRSAALNTLIEFSHRASSGLSVVLIGGLAWGAFVRFRRGHLVRKAATAAVIFIFTEALIGAALVLFHFVEQDRSIGRVISLALHLTNTFLLMASVAAVITWRGTKSLSRRQSGSRTFSLGVIALAGCLGVGITGSLAALGDTLFPATGTLLQSVGQDFSAASDILLRIRIFHPVLALTEAAIIFAYARALMTGGAPRRARDGGQYLIALVTAQLVLGAMNVALHAPVWMQLFHLGMAEVVWITLVMTFLASISADEPLHASLRAHPAPGAARGLPIDRRGIEGAEAPAQADGFPGQLS